MITVKLLLVALLSMFPRFPTRQCIIDHSESIVQQVTQAEQTRHVPPGILLMVGFQETHLGCDANEGGGWGAPISRFHRHVAGTSDDAARILVHSYEACGNWIRAITRFRSGACSLTPDDYRMPYVHRSESLINRLYARAHMPSVDLRAFRQVSILPTPSTSSELNNPANTYPYLDLLNFGNLYTQPEQTPYIQLVSYQQ